MCDCGCRTFVRTSPRRSKMSKEYVLKTIAARCDTWENALVKVRTLEDSCERNGVIFDVDGIAEIDWEHERVMTNL